MEIVVKVEDGTQMVLEVERSDTVLSVKDKIPDVKVLLRWEEEILSTLRSSKLWGYFKIGKDLFFKGQLLEDFRVLADYEIEDNDTLELFIPWEGGLVASTVMYKNPKKPEFITVFVDLPNGKRMTMKVDRTLHYSFIIEQIPDSELIPTARQILKSMIPEMKTGVKINVSFRTSLSLDGQILSNGTLEECNIKNNDVFKVYVHVSWEEDHSKS